MQLPSVLFPQAHVDPVGSEFSVLARSQVHSPAGRAPVRFLLVAWFRRDGGERRGAKAKHKGGDGLNREGVYVRHEQRAPWMVFSVDFLSHVQFMADCLPHEQVAFWAQTHSEERPQQVVGLTILAGGLRDGLTGFRI